MGFLQLLAGSFVLMMTFLESMLLLSLLKK